MSFSKTKIKINKKSKTLLLLAVIMFGGKASAQVLPYKNTNLSAHERAVDLTSRLTLKEKADLMCDESPAIPRLGIKPFSWWSEALHGLANQGNVTLNQSAWRHRLMCLLLRRCSRWRVTRPAPSGTSNIRTAFPLQDSTAFRCGLPM